MHQKSLVKQAWEGAGLYEAADPKLTQFLKLLDTTPTDCWPQLVDQCRRNYGQYMANLVQPIWETGDKVVRLNLIHYADVTRNDEVGILLKLVAGCDPSRDTLELKAIMRTGSPDLVDAVNKLLAAPAKRSAVVGGAAAAEADEKAKPAPAPAKGSGGVPPRPK